MPKLRFPRAAVVAAATVVPLALALTACSQSADSGTDTAADTDSASALSHIHGLGLHKGTLYVATHQGIHSPGPGGAPVLVGDRRDDFMGFTVAPDGIFLASGHPAPGSGGPSDLGLIASADAGRTWTEQSLGVEVDFHALDPARGGPVCG
ncbi:hypothetical protein [Streptomyces sp. NPDC059762]|uniref:hypothetical protein n=1 Tax=Streptomyces sp. NPDC059762 TaxID=3346938 RepID=UPI003657584D